MINNQRHVNMTNTYHRILYKVSGEALMGTKAYGHDSEVLTAIAQDIAQVIRSGVQVGIVVGGGNIFRGVHVSAHSVNRINADYMGMLATVINAMALQTAIEATGVAAVVQTAIAMEPMCERFNARTADAELNRNTVVIFAGGTGSPYFTTDTAAVLRGLEIRSDAVFKGSQVDGIYSADPKQDPQAVHLPKLTFQTALEQGYKVMDAAAFGLAKEHNLPIVVFNIADQLSSVLAGKVKHTVVGQ